MRAMVAWTPRNIIVVAVLISAVVGGVVGLGVTYALHPTPAPQTRDFYMFAIDQSFPAENTTGLKADYAFSAMTITVNKGDTLIIHFYNPTDQAHTFTIGTPYTNAVTVPAMTSTHIRALRASGLVEKKVELERSVYLEINPRLFGPP